MKSKVGDSIRLYGYCGTFEVTRIVDRRVYVSRDGKELFWSIDESIVEVNGQPTPLNSCPISPPAEDYPHEPLFHYNDGPASFGEWAIKKWKSFQATKAKLAALDAMDEARKLKQASDACEIVDQMRSLPASEVLKPKPVDAADRIQVIQVGN